MGRWNTSRILRIDSWERNYRVILRSAKLNKTLLLIPYNMKLLDQNVNQSNDSKIWCWKFHLIKFIHLDN